MTTALPADRRPEAVHAAQIRSSFQHLPLTLSVSILNSLLLGFVLVPVVSPAIMVFWVGLMGALSALRIGLWFAHRRHDAGRPLPLGWGILATFGTLLAGVLWGCTPVLFAPLDEVHLLFLALVIAGMCAGAATVHAAHFPSVIAFIIPGIVPLAGTFFALGGRLQTVSGLMTVTFGISLCVASARFGQWFRDTTEAQLSLAARTKELDETNGLLTAEMSSHRSTEAKFQQAQKLEAIGRLTAGIAHDFNNLLMAVSGSAGLIAMRAGMEAAYAPHLTTIMQSVERGTTLTRRLLAFGRQQALTPRSVDINGVVSGLKELLAATLAGYGRLDLRLERAPVTAFVDVNQLEQAILNLVINARDAMPGGGVVTITTREMDLSGDEAGTEQLVGRFGLIAVSDTGVGMPEHVRLRAFDPFFTTKDVGEGSGLGLSQVYGLVQQSGGATRIDSEPGKGTTVSIYLPEGRSETALAPSSHRSMPAPRSELREGRRIMLVDDDDDVRQTLTAMLDAAGYTVASFGTPRQALEELRRESLVDVMVVDFAMPELRGDDFAAEARRLRHTVPIIFVTGYAEPAAIRSEPRVLQKPFRAASLIRMVEQAVSDTEALSSRV
ncbi:MAG TPA: ATP-binding protein [Acetobacteraceae bacterium]|nr:ATP-binding protein [Acetobacteraceae bacterium]